MTHLPATENKVPETDQRVISIGILREFITAVINNLNKPEEKNSILRKKN